MSGILNSDRQSEVLATLHLFEVPLPDAIAQRADDVVTIRYDGTSRDDEMVLWQIFKVDDLPKLPDFLEAVRALPFNDDAFFKATSTGMRLYLNDEIHAGIIADAKTEADKREVPVVLAIKELMVMGAPNEILPPKTPAFEYNEFDSLEPENVFHALDARLENNSPGLM